MKGVIKSILALGLFMISLNGCYTMVGVAEEEQIYSSIENEEEQINEDDELTSGYFDEEMEKEYSEDYNTMQNEVHYEESSVDFFTVFSDAFNGFISSGALNIVIDLSSGSSSSSSDSNYSDNNSRNNSGSRNSAR